MSMPDVQYPINTYGWLKKAVSLWADRDDDEFVNQIPNFINFAEKEIYRNLRIPAMEKEAYLNIKDGVCFIPPDLLEIKWIMTSKTGQMFRSTSPEEVDWLKRNKTKNSTDFNQGEITFTRLGSRLFFYPLIDAELPPSNLAPDDVPPDSAVVINYYQDTKEMTDDYDKNVLLTIAPELLLYFTLRHASLFIQDDSGVQKWSALGKSMLDEIVAQADKMEYSGSPLVIPNAFANLNNTTHFGWMRTSM